MHARTRLHHIFKETSLLDKSCSSWTVHELFRLWRLWSIDVVFAHGSFLCRCWSFSCRMTQGTLVCVLPLLCVIHELCHEQSYVFTVFCAVSRIVCVLTEVHFASFMNNIIWSTFRAACLSNAQIVSPASRIVAHWRSLCMFTLCCG